MDQFTKSHVGATITPMCDPRVLAQSLLSITHGHRAAYGGLHRVLCDSPVHLALFQTRLIPYRSKTALQWQVPSRRHCHPLLPYLASGELMSVLSCPRSTHTTRTDAVHNLLMGAGVVWASQGGKLKRLGQGECRTDTSPP